MELAFTNFLARDQQIMTMEKEEEIQMLARQVKYGSIDVPRTVGVQALTQLYRK
jgi:hypothetical protein